MRIWCSAGHVVMRDMGFLRRGCEAFGFDAFNHSTSNTTVNARFVYIYAIKLLSMLFSVFYYLSEGCVIYFVHLNA
jgi:hypothetical protein